MDCSSPTRSAPPPRPRPTSGSRSRWALLSRSTPPRCPAPTGRRPSAPRSSSPARGCRSSSPPTPIRPRARRSSPRRRARSAPLASTAGRSRPRSTPVRSSCSPTGCRLTRRRRSGLLGRDPEAPLVRAVELSPVPRDALAISRRGCLCTFERGRQGVEAEVPAGGVARGLEPVVEGMDEHQQAALVVYVSDRASGGRLELGRGRVPAPELVGLGQRPPDPLRGVGEDALEAQDGATLIVLEHCVAGVRHRSLPLVEVAFEGVEASSPQTPVGGEPALELLEPGGAQLVEAPLAVRARRDEPGLAQDPQVPRGVRLAQTRLLNELANRAGALDQAVEELPPRRLGHGLEHGRHPGPYLSKRL